MPYQPWRAGNIQIGVGNAFLGCEVDFPSFHSQLSCYVALLTPSQLPSLSNKPFIIFSVSGAPSLFPSVLYPIFSQAVLPFPAVRKPSAASCNLPKIMQTIPEQNWQQNLDFMTPSASFYYHTRLLYSLA